MNFDDMVLNVLDVETNRIYINKMYRMIFFHLSGHASTDDLSAQYLFAKIMKN